MRVLLMKLVRVWKISLICLTVSAHLNASDDLKESQDVSHEGKGEGKSEGDKSPGEQLPQGAVLVMKVPVNSPEYLASALTQGGLMSLKHGVPVLFVPDLDQVPDPKVNEYDEKTGLTPLHKECLKDSPSPEVLGLFLEKYEADIELPTKSPYEKPGLTAMQLAQEKGHTVLAKYIYRFRAPNEYDEELGLTAFHELCMCKKTEQILPKIKELVEAGKVDLSLKTKAPYKDEGLTASELATVCDNEEVAEYLEEQSE